MKIKQPIYLTLAVAGIILLFAGPSLLGKEYGLALGFALLLFGLYGISRKVTPAAEAKTAEEPPPLSSETSDPSGDASYPSGETADPSDDPSYSLSDEHKSASSSSAKPAAPRGGSSSSADV